MPATEMYRIRPGDAVDLSTRDTRDTSLYPDLKKRASAPVLASLTKRLSEQQRKLWANGGHSLLLVIQAMDTGGKDGTIRKVFSGVNPQGVDVHGFGVPSELELSHDYLWRVHARTPSAGRIGVFNRSHYEDVLIVRVLNLVPEARWSARFDQIRAFEDMLVQEGTVVVKIMLNISKSEQKERLEARLEDPSKHYKFNPSDLATRARWDEYMLAYQDAIERTSTDAAPWYIVPADRKWYRNLAVSRILIDTLEDLELEFPEPEFDPDAVVIN